MGYNPGLVLRGLRLPEPIYYSPEEIESYRVFMHEFYAPLTTYLHLTSDSHEQKLSKLATSYSGLSTVLFYVKYEDLPLCICGHHNAKNGYFNIAYDRTIKWRLDNGK